MTCMHCIIYLYKYPVERLIVKISASKSVPVVFDYFDVPEGVEGSFRVKRKHCQTLTSGSKVERLFSSAGKVYRPERCRLTDKMIETLTFIK